MSPNSTSNPIDKSDNIHLLKQAMHSEPFRPQINTEYSILPAANQNLSIKIATNVLGHGRPYLHFEEKDSPQRIAITFDKIKKTSMIFSIMGGDIVCLTPNKIVLGSYLNF